MNYSIQDEPQGQKPVVGYTIQLGGPPQPSPEQTEAQKQALQFMNEPRFMQQFTGQMRNLYAEARLKESHMVLSYMREIRSALDTNSLTVAEGDGGATARPPLIPAFDDINRGKLQSAYLRLAERAINHVDFFMHRELGIPLTNEIKLAPKNNE